ncbi:MAG: hypothetical protein AAF231_15860 [Pseudomonadota bacterium]
MPVLADLACVGTILAIALTRPSDGPKRWQIPAGLGAVVLAFTLFQLSQDGLWRFWTNHTTDLTGNQVGFDLIIAIAIGFYLIAPRARAVGMSLLPWGIAVFATACIALLLMLACLLWLENRCQPTNSA